MTAGRISQGSQEWFHEDLRQLSVMKKIRLDDLMVEKGYAEDLKHAGALIMSGAVYLDNRKADKAGLAVPATADLEVRGSGRRYVSRGGLKLEGALHGFGISPDGKICADLGSSTGGFTDCLLKHGALRVYAFDVGKGLLDWQLQGDSRVILKEKFNVRNIGSSDVSEHIELVTVDLSFISLGLIIPRIREAFPGADVLLLVKPQFEGKPEEIGKGGIVREEEKRLEILDRVRETALENNFAIMGDMPSPVTGQKGNQEYFLWIRAERSMDPE